MRDCILVIGAHPDDELLGTAGTLKRFVDEGHQVISIVVALGRKEEAHHILIDQARQRKISLQQEIVKTRQLQGDERNTLQARITSLRVQLAGIDAQLGQ